MIECGEATPCGNHGGLGAIFGDETRDEAFTVPLALLDKRIGLTPITGGCVPLVDRLHAILQRRDAQIHARCVFCDQFVEDILSITVLGIE